MQINLPVPDEFTDELRHEMQQVAVAAFKEAGAKHAAADYMDVKHVAEYLGVSTATVRKFTVMGMPRIQIDGVTRYNKAAVDQFMHSYEQ
ncbi:hypothetical protein FC50_GL000020 [Lacticaseibacillus pantheris DSM 15945 = JCM 12539 = NBRC 106106]|uniref:Helix-turn-helix domain-containing protein n=1 Tax=Lacticaseibacillus pantheris DSM 15945 = JCM 12539 = NBRC 106106 TaxID=1423783 RepID=A0A0R1UBD0_9LACO|nr:helix-turn-helix domain-containing protein [Lacticaseibacillus pantheris]KRL87051.1 hypothetical protein FC50_GL000020 [Lacticaseibacillus pantheris DSM 15945 = JCM 12539 = NBRC 106106]